MDYRVQQAIASSITALVAIAAIWGFDLSVLNEPWLNSLIIAAAGALGSFLLKPPPPRQPTLTEAYHLVQKAEQARDHERWRAAAQPDSLHADDGFRRPD